MESDESVSQWLGQLQAGDPTAAQKLWERYFRRLVGLARKKLRAAPRRAADEEDVALSAFTGFCCKVGVWNVSGPHHTTGVTGDGCGPGG